MSGGRARLFAVDHDAAQVIDDGHVHDVPLGPGIPEVAAPPGAVRGRIATISDLHVGGSGFGILPRVREDPDLYGEHFTLRAARAAIHEAVAWGAELLVVKGDITYLAAPRQWAAAAQVLADCPIPVVAMVGNHDITARGQDGRPWLADAGVKTIVDAENPYDHVDVAGVRIVMAHTTTMFHGPGQIDAPTRDGVCRLLDERGAGDGALLAMHHYPNRFRVRTRYPVGIPLAEADELLHSLREVRPPTLITTGHTHRHRRYRRAGLEISEVGSTKDYPGVWAGYVVHEGGVRQVVRRIADPSVVAWTERTRAACLGLWQHWTPGRLSWRCFSLPWR